LFHSAFVLSADAGVDKVGRDHAQVRTFLLICMTVVVSGVMLVAMLVVMFRESLGASLIFVVDEVTSPCSLSKNQWDSYPRPLSPMQMLDEANSWKDVDGAPFGRAVLPIPKNFSNAAQSTTSKKRKQVDVHFSQAVDSRRQLRPIKIK